MNEKSLRVLEYFKIKDMLKEKASSSLGKEKVDALMPSSDLQWIKAGIEETNEATGIIIQKGSVPMGPILDINKSIKMAEIGSYLGPGQLLQIADTLRTSRRLKQYIESEEDVETKFPTLFGLANCIMTNRPFEDRIEISIISDTELSDNASHELKTIRRKIESKNTAIRNKLESIITSPSYQKYLQDSLVTIRQDRFVVPVKSEHKNSIKGMVHDQSASGSTFYIEPIAVVELNNELRTLRIDEKREIERILIELTGLVAEMAEGLKINLNTLTDLDFIFAKGKFSLDLKGIGPEFSTEKKFRIKNGRHPLIPKDEIVPSNIWLGESFNTLLITGPNTGGKTVTLKTVGLLTLMAQSGLHIPADYGTSLCVFDQVFADIGDEQSIEQSLSTFSSHMTNIVDILENVTADSLVLFDELGAGTDPTEGAALAMAILNQLYEKKIRTLATTHYSELKEYAITHDGVENASVEFDVATLSPTYRLLIGVPGKSNAFEISRKLGLRDDVIESAKVYVHRDNIQFEEILSNIEKSRKEAEQERDEAIRLRLDIEKLKKRLAEKESKLNGQRDKIVSGAKEEARVILKKAKSESDEIIKSLRNLKTKSDKEKNKEIENMRKRMRDNLDNVTENFLEEVEVVNVPKNLKIGDSVKLMNLGQVGTVASKVDKDGNLQVQVGIMKVKSNIKNLMLVKESVKEENLSFKKARKSMTMKAKFASTELDVRGKNIEEARVIIDKFLDDAALANLESVRIIHGKGTGALRKGLQDFFRRHPHIKKHRLGDFGEGGDGVTICEIK